MSEKELKPCPFCGEQVFTPLVSSLDDGYTRCISCGAKMQRSRWQTRPIEDALRLRIAELSQAVGLITTLKPTMVMDTEHPLDMAKEVAEYVTVRIAELEAEIDQLTAHSDIERQDDKWIPEVE